MNIKSVTINYNCQENEKADGFKGLTEDEVKSLKNIVNKLYENGIKLKLTFTENVNTISDNVCHHYL